MKKFLFILLLLPLSATADVFGFQGSLDGEYNLDTEDSTLTAEVSRTFSIYGFSVAGDVDFDLIDLEYDGLDLKAEYDILDANSTSIYVSSGLDTDWEMEDVKVGFEVKF